MILEVNNTFDERRMYFLKGPAARDKGKDTPSMDVNHTSKWCRSQEAENPQVVKDINGNSDKFINTWAKDFHVSPFNSRKGSYALAAHDPHFPRMEGKGPVDNVITLSSSTQHMKLVARVFSTQPSMQPSEMTFMRMVRFLLSWWWVGFVTFPRIVKEAGKLFFRRKLHIWYRPEVLQDSIGRKETSEEKYGRPVILYIQHLLTFCRFLERRFRDFLKDQIRHSNIDTPVKYIGSCTDCRREEIFLPATLQCRTAQADNLEELSIKILTPAFYTRFVQYAHPSEFIDNELLAGEEKDRTFWVSKLDLTSRLFCRFKATEPVIEPSEPLKGLDRTRWAILKNLRTSSRRRSQKNRSNLTMKPAVRFTDIRKFPLSPLDNFVIDHCTSADVRQYRRLVTKLLVANRIAFGLPSILDLGDIIIRSVSYKFAIHAIGGTLKWDGHLPPSMFEIAMLVCFCNSMHIWAFVKYML